MLGILFEMSHFIIAAKNKRDNAKYIGIYFVFWLVFINCIINYTY